MPNLDLQTLDSNPGLSVPYAAVAQSATSIFYLEFNSSPIKIPFRSEDLRSSEALPPTKSAFEIVLLA